MTTIPTGRRLDRSTIVKATEAADYFAVTPKTVRTWIGLGYIEGFLMPGTRGVFVDLRDIENALRNHPTSQMRSPRTQFGPNARITVLPPSPPEDDADPDDPTLEAARFTVVAGAPL